MVAGGLKGEGKQQVADAGQERSNGLGFQTWPQLRRTAWRNLSKVRDLPENGLRWVHKTAQMRTRHVAVAGFRGPNWSWVLASAWRSLPRSGCRLGWQVHCPDAKKLEPRMLERVARQ